MKRLIIIVTLLLSLSSCSDWLKAVSSTQFQERDLFSTKEGFQDALTGVYISMGSYDIYGAKSTFGVLDELVYPYNTILGSYFQLHLYSIVNVYDAFDSMWLAYYKSLANINLILSHLDNSRELFSSDKEYDLYYGELLGLRAFIHFDLMRVYGLPDWGGENASKRTVPFQLHFTHQSPTQLTYADAEKQLFEDLDASIKYLAQDPIRGVEDPDFDRISNIDGYWNYRNLHFNYYAALALKARILQWKGDSESAATIAQSVIDGAFDSGAVSWVDCAALLNTGIASEKNWSFTSEHLFALDVKELDSDYATRLFAQNALSFNIVYSIPEKIVKGVLYPDVNSYGQMSGAEDVRGPAFQMKFYSNSYVCYKLYCESTSAYGLRNKRPLIRISEMYYILAENAIKQGDNKAALAYINTVRKARNIQEDLPDVANAMEELNKEYYREFINEGQLFFWLKHHGLDDYLGTDYINLTSDMLILPYPKDELVYGRIQDQ